MENQNTYEISVNNFAKALNNCLIKCDKKITDDDLQQLISTFSDVQNANSSNDIEIIRTNKSIFLDATSNSDTLLFLFNRHVNLDENIVKEKFQQFITAIQKLIRKKDSLSLKKAFYALTPLGNLLTNHIGTPIDFKTLNKTNADREIFIFYLDQAIEKEQTTKNGTTYAVALHIFDNVYEQSQSLVQFSDFFHIATINLSYLKSLLGYAQNTEKNKTLISKYTSLLSKNIRELIQSNRETINSISLNGENLDNFTIGLKFWQMLDKIDLESFDPDYGFFTQNSVEPNIDFSQLNNHPKIYLSIFQYYLKKALKTDHKELRCFNLACEIFLEELESNSFKRHFEAFLFVASNDKKSILDALKHDQNYILLKSLKHLIIDNIQIFENYDEQYPLIEIIHTLYPRDTSLDFTSELHSTEHPSVVWNSILNFPDELKNFKEKYAYALNFSSNDSHIPFTDEKILKTYPALNYLHKNLSSSKPVAPSQICIIFDELKQKNDSYKLMKKNALNQLRSSYKRLTIYTIIVLAMQYITFFIYTMPPPILLPAMVFASFLSINIILSACFLLSNVQYDGQNLSRINTLQTLFIQSLFVALVITSVTGLNLGTLGLIWLYSLSIPLQSIYRNYHTCHDLIHKQTTEKSIKLIEGFGLNAFFYVDQNDDISPLHGYTA
ncbi:MAG: hypothetical protein P8L77_03200 [Gammaproteobacteria bacterium]|nr:hypothetical protein [Gammaproteobacteria bacterium]